MTSSYTSWKFSAPLSAVPSSASRGKGWLEGGGGNWSQWEPQMLCLTNQNLPLPSVLSFWFEKYLGLVRFVSLKTGKTPKIPNCIIQTFFLVAILYFYGEHMGSSLFVQTAADGLLLLSQKWKAALAGYFAQESTCFYPHSGLKE